MGYFCAASGQLVSQEERLAGDDPVRGGCLLWVIRYSLWAMEYLLRGLVANYSARRTALLEEILPEVGAFRGC